MTGWIKLHRKINEWEWRTKPNTFSVFIDLLTNANRESKKYRGIEIEPGQLTSSYGAIAKRTGLTTQNVRTCFTHLASTGELTWEKVNNCLLISIVNWSSYQLGNTVANTQLTHDQHTTNTRLTTNKKEKKKEKEKKEKKNNISGVVNKTTPRETYDFETPYKNYYPRKGGGKAKGMENLTRDIKTDQDYQDFCIAIENYSLEMRASDTETKHIKYFSTFSNCWRDYLEISTDAKSLKTGIEFLEECKRLQKEHGGD